MYHMYRWPHAQTEVSWLSDGWLSFPYTKLQSSCQVVLSTMCWYGLHASQSHMSFMCQTESKQRHEGSFRAACFSFLWAKATLEVCVSTTESVGGRVAARGPYRPKSIHGASCWELRRSSSSSSCSSDGLERVGWRQFFAGSILLYEEQGTHGYTVHSEWFFCHFFKHPLSFYVSDYVSSLSFPVLP